MSTNNYAGLIRALRDQEQCDESGERCSVSRQAVDEAIAALEAVQVEPVAWTFPLNPPIGFIEYVAANYSGEVVFSDPEWHAKRLWNAAMRNAAPQEAVPAINDVLYQTQILRDSADRLIDSGYSATGAEIRMAAKAIEAALAKATHEPR
jgi:hypothetical protein